MLCFGRDISRSSNPSPSKEQGHLQAGQAPQIPFEIRQVPFNLVLNGSRDRECITKLFWCSTTLFVKTFFLIPNLNQSSVSLKPLVLLQQALLKKIESRKCFIRLTCLFCSVCFSHLVWYHHLCHFNSHPPPALHCIDFQAGMKTNPL